MLLFFSFGRARATLLRRLSILVVVVALAAPSSSNPLALSPSLSSPPSHHRVEHIYRGKGIVSLQSLDAQTIVAGTKRGNLELFQWHSNNQTLIPYGTIIDNKPQPMSKTINKQQNQIPYPIYSLLMLQVKKNKKKKKQQLFCGGGDRYITIWENNNNNNNNNNDNDDTTSIRSKEGWKMVQKLGPHTGWVKALSSSSSLSSSLDRTSTSATTIPVGGTQHDLVHSIGCNCIETWIRNDDDDDDDEWKHKTKRTIESDPDLGSTLLSSDLLCLAQSQRSPWQDVLCSGGVDGRIHLWSCNPDVSLQPIQSIPAHNGRVNTLVMIPLFSTTDDPGATTTTTTTTTRGASSSSSSCCLLFSAGHDGMLQCRKLETTTRNTTSTTTGLQGSIALTEQPIGSLMLLDEQHDCQPLRVTAMTCCRVLRGENNKTTTTCVEVTLGTTSGWLIQVHAHAGAAAVTNNDDDDGTMISWNTCVMKEHCRIDLGTTNETTTTTIHSLMKITREQELLVANPVTTNLSSRSAIVVGHSQGLSMVSLSDDPDLTPTK